MCRLWATNACRYPTSRTVIWPASSVVVTRSPYRLQLCKRRELRIVYMWQHADQPKAPRLLWVHAAPLLTALDGATWLETTRHLRLMGWDVVLLGEGPRGHHVVGGVEIQCLPKPGRYLIGTVLFHLSVLRLIIKHFDEIDVLLFHQMSAIWLLPLKFLRAVMGRSYPKLVMDTRDLPTTESGFKNRLRSAYFSLVHWFANHAADGQTAITRRMVELVSIPADNLWGIWPSGVEVARFADAEDGRVWPQADQPIRLCYIGSLIWNGIWFLFAKR